MATSGRGARSSCTDRSEDKVGTSLPFAADDFDVDRYLSNRPRYPSHLYAVIRSYIAAGSKGRGNEPAVSVSSPGTLLDIGCGPGFASFPLLEHPHFEKLIGVDTSKGMIRSAPQAYQAWLSGLAPDSQQKKDVQGKDVSFSVCSSSDMNGIVPDNCVTLAIAATAAHWFQPGPTWNELTRVVRPGGSVVFVTYGENYLPRHAHLQEHIFHFMQGESSKGDSIGPYFPQPGRSYLTNLLQDVPFPHELTSAEDSPSASTGQQWDIPSATRRFHPLARRGFADLSWTSDPDAHKRPLHADPFRLEQVMSWERYESYIRSASAYHAYMRQHPEEREGPEDVVGRFVQMLKGKVAADRERGVGVEEGLDEAHVRVAWPLGLMAIRKKAPVD